MREPDSSPVRGAREVVYAYGFVDGRRAPPDPDSASALGVSVRQFGAVGAVMRMVRLDDFRRPGSKTSLGDPSWAAPRAWEHEAVLESVMRWSPVFPLGFATLFAGPTGVARFIDRHRPTIEGFLRHVDGKEEWGVKVCARLDRLRRLEVPAIANWPGWRPLEPEDPCPPPPQSLGVSVELARLRARCLTHELIEDLWPVGAELRRLSGSAADPAATVETIGSWALLINCARIRELKRRIGAGAARAAEHGISVQLSGPWPPFSFRPVLGPAYPDAVSTRNRFFVPEDC